jgi:AcrR family transcriptional regulator
LTVAAKKVREAPVPDEDRSAGPAWRARAVERSLERSRAEAEQRSSRFVSVALQLVEQTGKDFTVQDIVEKMHVSTRTFYQFFTGKDELLVAMIEEIQRARHKELLRLVAEEPDPLSRLRAFVLGNLGFERRQGGMSRLMVQQYFRLQMNHPDELRHSYKGIVSYLSSLIADAAEAGEIESGDHDRTAAMILQIITTTIQMMVIGSPLMDPPPSPDEVWHFCLAGLGAQPAVEGNQPASPRRRSRG